MSEQQGINLTPDDQAEARAPQPMAAARVCVVGTAEALQAFGPELALLDGDPRVSRIEWRLDDEFGEPPVEADWAEGLIVLNANVWAAPTGCARLQALLRMAWRCGRTIALCNEATESLITLGFAADVPAEAEGLFLCPRGPCEGMLREFLDAVHEQPHRSR